MGRVKLRIEKLESANARQVTYSKRKIGIMKKAKELSILCDIDVMLVMFSPSGKPTVCVGEKSDFCGVIEKFARVTPQERSKRRLEILEVLKKTFKKLDHKVDIQELLCGGTQRIEELRNQLRLLQAQFSETHYKWSCWTNPENMNDIVQVRTMEESLMESLCRLRKHKPLDFESSPSRFIAMFENLKTPLSSMFSLVDSSSNLKEQLGKQSAYGTWASQQAQPISWLPNHNFVYERLHGDPNLEFAQRDIGCFMNHSLPTLSQPLCIGQSSFLEEGLGMGENPNNLIENMGPGLQLGFQYPYQQPECNFGGFERLKSRMDLNPSGSCMNLVQDLEQARLGYEANFPYSYLTSTTQASESMLARNYNIN